MPDDAAPVLTQQRVGGDQPPGSARSRERGRNRSEQGPVAVGELGSVDLSASWWRNTMISRSLERPERTVSRASDARNRYEIRYTTNQHRPASRQVNDHGRVSGTHTQRTDMVPLATRTSGFSRNPIKRTGHEVAATSSWFPSGPVRKVFEWHRHQQTTPEGATMPRTRLIVPVMLAVALLAAACGGGVVVAD